MAGRPNVFEWNYYVYQVDGKNDIIELLAAANNYDVADAAFGALEKCSSHSTIQLRYKSGIRKTTRVGAYDSATATSSIEWRINGGIPEPELQPRKLR